MSTSMLTRQRTGAALVLGEELAAGGEGRVFAIPSEPGLVAKIYHRPNPERATKLDVMLAHPPVDPTRQRGHVSIAWPVDRVCNTQGNCIGFVMPFLDFSRSISLLKLYHPKDRAQSAPDFTWQYLMRTASNLASVVEALHTANYVVGDLNESNVLVSNTALATLVDCDSMQVRGPDGHVFRCTVGKGDYTPPELQGASFSRIDREPKHDNFALAVLTFLLLMEGVHPFDGVWHAAGAGPTRDERIQLGLWPYGGSGVKKVTPPPLALPFSALPPRIQTLTKRCFLEGYRNPSLRPSAREWRDALQEAEAGLSRCRVNPQHWYSQHLSSCPWCVRMAQLKVPDPFPAHGQQRPLSPVPVVPRRVRPSVPPGVSLHSQPMSAVAAPSSPSKRATTSPP